MSHSDFKRNHGSGVPAEPSACRAASGYIRSAPVCTVTRQIHALRADQPWRCASSGADSAAAAAGAFAVASASLVASASFLAASAAASTSFLAASAAAPSDDRASAPAVPPAPRAVPSFGMTCSLHHVAASAPCQSLTKKHYYTRDTLAG